MNKTPIHNIIHTNMNDREFNAAYITSPYYGVPPVKISLYMYVFPDIPL